MIKELEVLKPKPHRTKSAFKKHGVTQDLLALYFNVSQPLVSRWLTGKKEIPRAIERELQRLAEKLDVSSK